MPVKVLIVDDDAAFRRIARGALAERGYDVVAEAQSVAEARTAVAAAHPDAVLLDVNLPDGNGIDLCRALTAADPALAVLLVSADAGNGRWAGDCGAVAFVPKVRLASADLDGLLRGAGGGQELSDRATG